MRWSDVLDTDTKWSFHFELSNNCNSKCPLCPRYVRGTSTLRPGLVLGQVSLNDFKKWIPVDILKKTYKINFCGTQGDPILCKDFYEILKYITDVSSDINIQIRTNGGVRNETFWKNLGKIVNGNKQVVFSIDGLSDTNHIYRRDVKWESLIRNVKSFIDSGGNAIWECLLFGHNEHQKSDIETLSREMGFSEVLFKSPIGFEHKILKKSISVPIYSESGNLEYLLKPSLKYLNSEYDYDANFKHPEKIDIQDTCLIWPYEIQYDHYSEFEGYDIDCKAFLEDENSVEVYVNPHGNVYPCCYTGASLDTGDVYSDTEQLKRILGDKKNYNLNYKTLEDIVLFFDDVIQSKWKESHKNGKCIYCSMTCGHSSELDVDRLYISNSEKKEQKII